MHTMPKMLIFLAVEMFFFFLMYTKNGKVLLKANPNHFWESMGLFLIIFDIYIVSLGVIMAYK